MKKQTELQKHSLNNHRFTFYDQSSVSTTHGLRTMQKYDFGLNKFSFRASYPTSNTNCTRSVYCVLVDRPSFLSFLHSDNDSHLAWFESTVYTSSDSNWIFGFIQRPSKQASKRRENKKERIIFYKLNNARYWTTYSDTIVWILFVFISHPIQCRLSFVAIIYIWILFYLHSETKCRFTHSCSFSLSISQ